MFRTGHIPDHPAVVARRLGMHLHPKYAEIRATPLPLATNNRAKLLVSAGGPGILNQNDTGSCFPAGTPVLMADGTERAIEEIGGGNEVRTHNGKRRRVTRTMRRQYEGALYTVEVHGYVYPTTMTSEHPVCVVRDARSSRHYEPGEIAWVPAKDVKPGDFVLMPSSRTPEDGSARTLRVTDFIEEDCLDVDGSVRCFSARRTSVIPSKIVVDELFAQLIGLFLAEGSYQKNAGLPGGVNFTFARGEREYQKFVVDALAAKFGVKAGVHETDSRPSVTDVTVQNETLAKFFHGLCGEGALTKMLPQFLYDSPHLVKLAALRGWLQGDGAQNALPAYKQSVQVHGCTSSEALHRGLFRLALSCGLKPGCQKRAEEAHQNAPSGSLYFYGNDAFAVFPERRTQASERGVEPNGKRKNYREHPLGFVARVKAVTVSETEDPIDVFNLEVDGEHTYIANAMAVHNCEGHAHASGITLRLALAGTPLPEVVSPVGLYLGALLVDRQPNADGTLPPLTDTGTMPSSILSAMGLWGSCGASTWGQYPASSTTMYQDPSNPNSALIAPTIEQLYAESSFKLGGAYFVQTSGLQKVLDVLATLASERPLSDAIPASGAGFQGYHGGILRAVDMTGAIDHANLIVDYAWTGTQEEFTAWQGGASGLDQMLVGYGANSWSENWGESDVAGLKGGMYRFDRTFFDQLQDPCVLDVKRA